MSLSRVSDVSVGKEIIWEDESESEYLSVLEEVEQQQETPTNSFNLKEESKLLLELALPAVAVQFSVFFIFPQTASVVGRVLGKEELAGFSLGSLVGNLTCLSVMVGALTAADTLMPRAYASGNYEEVGRIAIRGIMMCSVLLLIPIVPLCTIIEWIFEKLGQDIVASSLASQWIRIYLIGIPATLLFRVIQSFLNAQHKVWPLVYASISSCFIFHPIFLKIFISKFHFLGSSLSICMTQYVMISLLFLIMWMNPVHEKKTWPGLSMPYFLESIHPRPMVAFLSLSLGGVLSLSEWWFWEWVCIIVGSFGVVPLCVHTIAYNLVPLLFMIPLGIMIGLTVRLGHLIAYNVKHAKQLAAWCMLFTTILGAIVAYFLHRFREEIVMLFTNDKEVIKGCEEIWDNLCIYIFILYIFGINSAILRALGKQWYIAVIMFACLWLGTLGFLVVFAIRRGGGIETVWKILPFGYFLMQIALIYGYMTEDWLDCIKQKNTNYKSESESEQTKLLHKKHLTYD